MKNNSTSINALLALLLGVPAIFFGGNIPIVWNLLIATAGLMLLFVAYGKNDLKISKHIFVLFVLVFFWVIWQIFYISIDPLISVESVLKITAYTVFFMLSVMVGKNLKMANKLVVIFVVFSVVIAIYGFANLMLNEHYVLWVKKTMYVKNLTATFINRNSYATFAGLGALASAAMFMQQVAVLLKTRRLRHVFVELLSSKDSIYAVSFLFLVGGLILTSSRAGLFSLICGLLVFIFLALGSQGLRRAKRDKFNKILVSFALAVPIIVLAIAGNQIMERFAQVSDDFSNRQAIYSITIDAIKTAPITGTGLGTFEDVFNQNRTPTLPLWEDRVINHTHNTYLELALELGLPATILLLLAPFLAFVACIKGSFRRKRTTFLPALGASATVLVAVHALVDFSLEMPAIATVYAILLGLGYSQSFSSISKNHINNFQISKYFLYPTGFALLGLGLFLTHVYWGIYSAQAQLKKVRSNKEVSNHYLQQSVESFKAASQKWPNSKFYSELGFAELILSERQAGESKIKLKNSAITHLEKAVKINPLNPYAWLRIGLAKNSVSGNIKELANPLIMSIRTGPYKPRILYYRLEFLPQVWQHLTPAEQQEMFAYLWDILKHEKRRLWLKTQHNKPLQRLVVLAKQAGEK